MKKIISLLAIFVLVIIFATLGQLASGNVIIYFNEYKISFSLVFFIAGWLLSLIVLTLSWKIVRGTLAIPSSIAVFFTKRKQLKIDKMFNQALINYFAGNYLKSSKLAARLAKLKTTSEHQNLFLILAIESAIKYNNIALVNKLIDTITESVDSDINCAQKIIKAKAATLNQQYLHAITLLKEVLTLDNKNIAAHQLLLENYIYNNDAENAKECIKWLQKRKVMPLFLNEFYQRLGILN